ncbi:MAG TPA: hypothetical protein VKV26_11365 [Dehalococcoidia bacterium]|nr:hypothetical protein [Dehalococcoidia bacterium]
MTTIAPVQSTARRCGHTPVAAQITRYTDGRVFALSLTAPGQVYELRPTPSGWRCDCRGYQYRGSCYHAAAAVARFGVACWHCGAAEGVESYVNHYDGGARIELCARCAGQP